MYINNNKIFFDKITQEINGNVVDILVRKYSTDYRTQHFDTASHLHAMLFFQLKGLDSLREL